MEIFQNWTYLLVNSMHKFIWSILWKTEDVFPLISFTAKIGLLKTMYTVSIHALPACHSVSLQWTRPTWTTGRSKINLKKKKKNQICMVLTKLKFYSPDFSNGTRRWVGGQGDLLCCSIKINFDVILISCLFPSSPRSFWISYCSRV